MQIESIRIENFRAFKDETILFDNYACIVGPNGAGKSTALAALNVFFRQYRDSKTDLSKLIADDFHHKNVSDPIKITVTFTNLSAEAKSDLSDYVRQDKLIVSAIARYEPAIERAEVRQYGNRLGIEDFRKYFEAEKAGVSATDLKDLYADLKAQYADLASTKTKADMATALQEFEAQNSNLCSLIPSEDQFYGATKGANRLAAHIQWIFVPAVKDITEESQESKTSGLGQLLARTIRSKVNFSEKVGQLRNNLREGYQAMLDAEQSVLDGLSISLELKLKAWAHPEATAKVLWTQDSEKSIKVEEPWAHIRIGERGFEGELARFGHGMQRSYMLSLLQEIAGLDVSNAPTLILGIEEPELFQHPPQARYLAEVLSDLSEAGSQIILCTHSPLFIPGDNFESVRVVREIGKPAASQVFKLSYKQLSATLHAAGQKHLKEEGMLAKLYPALSANVNEMFFCKVLVLVEGIEDTAYISTYLALTGELERFRRCGCHIVAVDGKSEIIKPLAMAKQLKIPVYVVIDADTNETKDENIARHKKDNREISTLCGHGSLGEWPSDTIWESGLTVWPSNLTELAKAELGTPWTKHLDAARAHYGNAPDLKKNPLAVSRALKSAWDDGIKSPSLEKLAAAITAFSGEATSA
jgi:putative ATP-dependent endonuclease of the OLD family